MLLYTPLGRLEALRESEFPVQLVDHPLDPVARRARVRRARCVVPPDLPVAQGRFQVVNLRPKPAAIHGSMPIVAGPVTHLVGHRVLLPYVGSRRAHDVGVECSAVHPSGPAPCGEGSAGSGTRPCAGSISAGSSRLGPWRAAWRA